MVDRLAIEDDSRNKVNPETETVSMSEPLSESVRDGTIFAKLMAEMHRTFTMRTGTNFELQVTQPLA